MGFRLIEGHVLQDADMPTAQLVYRDSDENIVTLYFGATEESSEIAPTFIVDGELPQLHWRDHGFAYRIVGSNDRKQMLEIGSASCRVRVCQYGKITVGGGPIKKKNQKSE